MLQKKALGLVILGFGIFIILKAGGGGPAIEKALNKKSMALIDKLDNAVVASIGITFLFARSPVLFPKIVKASYYLAKAIDGAFCIGAIASGCFLISVIVASYRRKHRWSYENPALLSEVRILRK